MTDYSPSIPIKVDFGWLQDHLEKLREMDENFSAYEEYAAFLKEIDDYRSCLLED